MTGIEKYFILVIVVWRATHLINAEDGPFEIVLKLRKKLGNSFAGKLMDCFYCLSIWMGLIAALIPGRNAGEVVLLCLYYSGTAILLEKMTSKKMI